MHMPRRRAVLVSAITAGVWPVFAVYAADHTLRPQQETPVIPQQQAQTAPDLPHTFTGIRPESRAVGLKLDADAAPLASRQDEARHGLPANAAAPSARTEDFRHGALIEAASASSRPMNTGTGYSMAATGSRLNLSRAPYAPKTGWEMSGRAGPLRWLSPIDGEGETQVRLGGRLEGQPRMPGMGLFNIGIHYNFE